MHYKTRAKSYWGGGVVGSCFGVHFCPYFGEGFSHGKSSVVALVFGISMDSCQINA